MQQTPTHSPDQALQSLQALQETVGTRALELAVIIPTFNERANIPILIERLEGVLSGISYEVIVVDDDSPDGTWEAVRGLAAYQQRVRIIRRVGRRGLASACLEGMMSTAAAYVAVMDGDLQHDESILPRMFAAAREELNAPGMNCRWSGGEQLRH